MQRTNSSQRLRLLFVDDDTILRRTMQMIAPDMDFDIRVAGTEAEVLAFFDHGGVVDCVVCDFYLGHTTSTPLVDELMQRGQRVVLLTGVDSRRGGGLPNVPVFQKPIAIEDLLARVREEVARG